MDSQCVTKVKVKGSRNSQADRQGDCMQENNKKLMEGLSQSLDFQASLKYYAVANLAALDCSLALSILHCSLAPLVSVDSSLCRVCSCTIVQLLLLVQESYNFLAASDRLVPVCSAVSTSFAAACALKKCVQRSSSLVRHILAASDFLVVLISVGLASAHPNY